MSGTSTCEVCSTGKVAEKPGASGCATCQAGQYSLAEAQFCELCPKGKSSIANSKACTSCSAGYYSSNEGSVMCIACAAGSYSSALDSVNCSLCAPGTAQGATGQASCVACSPGAFSGAYGESSCSSCSGNRFSFTGAASCSRCLKDYYYFEGFCLPCPSGTNCDVDGVSTLIDLLIQPGWWRISEETDEIRQCAHGSLACRGGLNFSEGYCTDGHQGILCAVCSDDYYFDSEESRCIVCAHLPGPGQLWMSSPPLILFSIIVFCFLAFIIIMSCVSNRSAMNKRRQRSAWIERFIDRLNDAASLDNCGCRHRH